MQLPFEQPSPMRPAPLLRKLQIAGPIHAIRTAVGHPAWLVTGYEQVRALLDDDRLGRSHPQPETASRTGESALFGGPLGDFETEQADHRRMRSLLQPHFSPRRIRALRARVETLTAGLLDELAKRGMPADLHAALALPLPIAVICELLGVPYEDREQFRAWTQAASDITDRARSEQGLAELFGYGQRLVARKRAQGLARAGSDDDADVISRLAATEGVSDDEQPFPNVPIHPRSPPSRSATMPSTVGIAAIRISPESLSLRLLISCRIARASPTMRRAQSSVRSPSGVKP